MYKVLIVDDEILIRTNLKYMLNLEDNSFVLCGEASNGLEGLELIKKTKPDIILLDMKMPVMDGLQLSYEIKSNYPGLQMIILSNYDDFEYVKNTLKNGAVDYILKHNLNPDTLLDALLRAKAVLECSKPSIDSTIARPTIPNSLLALKEKFVIQLLTGLYSNEEEIKTHLDALQIKIHTTSVVFIEMAIDNYKSATDNNDLKDVSLLEFAIINIIEEILSAYNNGLITHILNEKFALILSFKDYRSTARIEKTINEILQRIAICLKEFISISVSFSIGDMCNNIVDIGKSYIKADDYLKNRFYTGKNSIINSNTIDDDKIINSGLSIELEKKLITHIKLQHKDGLLTLITEIFDNIRKDNLSLNGSQMIFFDLLSVINKISKENHINLTTIYSSPKTPHELLAELETLEDIRKWFFAVFTDMLKALGYERNPSNSEYVRKAVNFIRNHYNEDISLRYVAQQLNISSAYLSSLFKADNNEGFTQYLIRLRLDKAKALLTENKLDIRDIVKLCGFSNYDYFFKIFKKKVGMTPTEFIAIGEGCLTLMDQRAEDSL